MSLATNKSHYQAHTLIFHVKWNHMKDAKNLARAKILLSFSVVSQCYSDGGGFFVLCLFCTHFCSSVWSFFFPLFHHPYSPQPFPSIIATMWNKDDPSKGPCGSGLSRVDGNVVSPSCWRAKWQEQGGRSINTSFSWGTVGVGMTEQNWYKIPTWSRFCSWWLHRCKEEPNSKARPSSLISVPEVKAIFLGKIQADAYFLKVRTTVRKGDAGKGWGISHPKERCRNFQSFFTGTSYSTKQCNKFYNLFSNCPHRYIGGNQACGLRS